MLISLLALSLSAHAAPDPDTWALEDLFDSVDAWNTEREAVPAEFAKLTQCEGQLTKKPSVLADCMDDYFSILQRIERVYVFASTSSDTDVRNADASGRRTQAIGLWNQFQQATSFMSPELIAGEAKVRKALDKEPRLADYRRMLEGVLDEAPHTLSAEGEAIMASTGMVASGPGATYRALANADLPWPTVTLSDGTEARLDSAGYTKWRAAPNRADRELVFNAFFGAWNDYGNTIGNTLSTHVQAHIFNARVRNFPNSVSAAVHGNEVPEAVYRTLVAETRKNLPTLHRFLKLRAELLDLPDMGYHDLYVSPVESELSFDLATGKRLALESAAPLGEEYTAIVKQGFESRWIDAYPRQGKRSGAYQTGVYGVHPYVLLNYNDDYESVSTLAHEFGHAMHTWLANSTQPYPTADYTIFMAEVASTFNEALLLDYMLKDAASDADRLAYLVQAADAIRGTYFRQAMFAEFELAIHDAAEAGQPLTGATLTDIYGELVRAYHGADEGVMTIDPVIHNEWAYIPHFYSNFYVYQYATSIAASSLLAQRVMDGEEGSVENYLDLLRAGGSQPAYDLLAGAGVDLATPAPYTAMSDRMNAIMDEIEVVMGRMETASVEYQSESEEVANP